MTTTSSTPAVTDLIAELQWRGLLHQCTDEAGLREHLADPANAPRKIYSGFDPTAPSLTIGNLVPIMLLAHVKRAGHVAVALQGGGTGLIGDPSGKSAERQLNTAETVAANVEAQRPIFDAVLGNVEGHPHTIANNLDWLGGLGYIEALRDIGKHFSVNMMMQKESVKARLENREQGISYTEFSYMILQAYDFAHLYEHNGVTVQIGGSDQYGNIVAGTDLIRRIRRSKLSEVEVIFENISNAETARWMGKDYDFSGSGFFKEFRARFLSGLEAVETTDDLSMSDAAERYLRTITPYINVNDGVRVTEDWIESIRVFKSMRRCCEFVIQGPSFGVTAPLVTKADGTKFGKTESGAVWLTADKTSPYAYYQFWLNATDDDATNWIKIFTFLDRDEIEALIARHAENPGMRELQRTLAQHATTILHGEEAMHRAESAGKALFSGEIADLDEPTLLEVLADVPSSDHPKADLAGDGLDPIELLKRASLASSNREAREFLGNGSVSINGAKIDGDTRITESHLLHGSLIAVRRGKKKWHLTRWK